MMSQYAATLSKNQILKLKLLTIQVVKNKGTHQMALMCRLICACVVGILQKAVFLVKFACSAEVIRCIFDDI